MSENNHNNEQENDSHSSKGTLLYYSPMILPEDLESNEDEKRNMKRFIHSIVREETDKFKQLLPKIDLNGNHNNGWTPIIWAIQKDRVSFLEEMLFKSGQIIDFSKQIDQKGQRTVLHFAAEKGDLELVNMILNKDKQQQNSPNITNKQKLKLKINATDREHSTALFRAAKVGEETIIKLLLQNGADPNITNRDGMTRIYIISILSWHSYDRYMYIIYRNITIIYSIASWIFRCCTRIIK